ncbi:MAG: sensor histidine kinase [Desulfosarcina sp.]|nr:sensor histidine kinase [Desulfobacterales bacterium]
MPCHKNGLGSGPTIVAGTMLDHSTFHQFLSEGNASIRLDFFKCHKEQIHAHLLGFIQSEPPTFYREFILNNTEGQERVRVFLDSFEAALSGDIETFFEDQKNIGYIRAMEGYHLNDVYGFTVAFKDSLWRTSREYNDSMHNPADRLNNDDIFTFNKLLDGSFYLLSLSFLETRDELIMRHRKQLQALQRFAAGVVSVFEEENIWAHTTQGVFDVFGLIGTFLLAGGDSFKGKGCEVGRMIGLQVAHRDLEKILKGIYRSLKPMGLDNSNTLHHLSSSMDTDQFRFVSSPIMGRKSRLTGVLCIHDQGRTFRFSKFDRNLFFQFCYFAGAVSANCRMVSEIAEKKEDLRNITTRLISAQEEERKKIAADIHDVLTQALTGIGYKALYCMEIVGQDLGRLYQELELLTETINDALRQSREIISNLRPHILDYIGIIAAFRKFIGDFRNKFDIDVRFSHSDNLQIDPDKGIALFRILQEALHNARRHSTATTVDLSLSLEKGGFLTMTVKDDGQGFDPRKRNRQRQWPGLGLLTMRERAEDLGGEFRVDSRPGKGCSVIVKIPLKEETDG